MIMAFLTGGNRKALQDFSKFFTKTLQSFVALRRRSVRQTLLYCHHNARIQWL